MATETSREGYVDNSALVGALIRLQAWLAATWIAQTIKTITNRLATATHTSTLSKDFRALARWTRHAFLYRWLTKEPEPDVIVIDLRETYTVGPFIALLDRMAPSVERTWHGSLAYRITERLQTSPKRVWFTESSTIQLLQAALEPPELPDAENDRDRAEK